MQDQAPIYGKWRVYDSVQLNGRHGPPSNVNVYEIIILGGGGKGEDHWGWPTDDMAHVHGANGRILRGDSASWAPVNKDGQLQLKFQDARSDEVTGVVRWITGSAHGTAVFKLALNDGHLS